MKELVLEPCYTRMTTVESQGVAVEMKECIPVVLFIALCKKAEAFESVGVDGLLKFGGHSIEAY